MICCKSPPLSIYIYIVPNSSLILSNIDPYVLDYVDIADKRAVELG